MHTTTIHLTSEDGVTLPGLGLVTGTAHYAEGAWGTRWDPPEPADVIVESIRDAFGIEIPDDYFGDHEDDYDALCEQVGALVEAEVVASWANMEANRTEDGWDADLPF